MDDSPPQGLFDLDKELRWRSLKGYDQNIITEVVADYSAARLRLVNFAYDIQPAVKRPYFCSPVRYRNQTSVTQSHTLSVDETLTESQTWTVTQGVTASIGLHVSVGPPFAQVRTDFTLSLSSQETQSKQEGTTKRWQATFPFSVPAHKGVEAFVIIDQEEYTVSFSGDLRIEGRVTFRWTIRETGSISRHEVVKDIRSLFEADPSARVSLQNEAVCVKLGGTFNGVRGVGTDVNTMEFDL